MSSLRRWRSAEKEPSESAVRKHLESIKKSESSENRSKQEDLKFFIYVPTKTLYGTIKLHAQKIDFGRYWRNLGRGQVWYHMISVPWEGGSRVGRDGVGILIVVVVVGCWLVRRCVAVCVSVCMRM